MKKKKRKNVVRKTGSKRKARKVRLFDSEFPTLGGARKKA